MAHPRPNTIFDMCHLILAVTSPLINKMQTKTFDHAPLISHRLQTSDWSRTSSVFLYKLLTRLSSNLVNTFISYATSQTRITYVMLYWILAISWSLIGRSVSINFQTNRWQYQFGRSTHYGPFVHAPLNFCPDSHSRGSSYSDALFYIYSICKCGYVLDCSSCYSSCFCFVAELIIVCLTTVLFVTLVVSVL